MLGFQLLTLLITAAFLISIKKEINKPEGSLLYKIYFLGRIFSQLIGFLVLGINFIFFNFAVHFEQQNLEEDVKTSILNSFDFMPYTYSQL